MPLSAISCLPGSFVSPGDNHAPGPACVHIFYAYINPAGEDGAMFEWDADKARRNRAKHRVDFTEIERFDFGTCIEFDVTEMAQDGEERVMAIGFIGVHLHVLIYTERGETMRLISLRRATPEETRLYHAEH
ncbi:MAG: BrnT family toxin [Roseitalea porphyridii]|uniref:BrnT family toxin n=2 Tax=Roseitalea porphyridii TaxID=1852022 RepID=UPI0032F04DE8